MSLQRHYNPYKSFFDAQVLKFKAGKAITGALPTSCTGGDFRKEAKHEGDHEELDPDVILIENRTPATSMAASDTTTSSSTPSEVVASAEISNSKAKRPPVTETEKWMLIRFLVSTTGGSEPNMEEFAKLVSMFPIVVF